MMVGLKSYGVYIPYFRLSRAEISKSWGGFPAPGERAVANYDEDTITMAVAACRDGLRGFDPQEIERLLLASTTFSYGEKQSASIVAAALDLKKEALTVDLSSSLRSGTTGVRLAFEAVRAGTSKNILVCASDIRMGLPNGPRELEFGDGASALLLGDTGVIATVDHMFSSNEDIYDVFRPVEENCVRSWEDRFCREAGYTQIMLETLTAAAKKFKFTAKDFAKAVLYAPNPGYLAGVARAAGFDLKTQVQDSLYSMVGNTGTALSSMMLAAALDEARPGDRILWVGYGDGCDVIVLTVTDEITKIQERKTVQKHLTAKNTLSYQKYLRWRSVIETEPPMRPKPEPASAVALYRDRKCGMALYGVKCKHCGTVQYPVQRICMNCLSKDNFEDYGFAHRIGRITTFSHDNLAVSPDPPSTVAVVDFDGGGRIMMDITDRDLSEIKIGMPVEMTFRHIRYVEGIHNYWWKCRPMRSSVLS